MNIQSHWATHFYVGKVADHDKVLAAMLPYINDDSNFTEPFIFSKCKSSCQSPNNSNFPWDVFYDAIRPNVAEYLDSLGPSCQYTIRSNEVWANIYEQHGYQEIHDHAFPNRSLSCAYVLEMPEGDNVGGELIFENTHFPVIQATGLNRIFDAFNYEKFIPKLEAGTLVMFPCWVKHYVLPNKTTQRRTTISANFSIEGTYK